MAAAVDFIREAFNQLKQLASGTFDAINAPVIINGIVEFIEKLTEQAIMDHARGDAHEKTIK